ncbi:MAG: hypothetical protein ACM3VW_03405, partial [Bacteroidota bacterium]
HMEGHYLSGSGAFQRRIRLGISTRDFYHNGLCTLFHELAHAQGMDHLSAIAYAHARLHELSGMKHMHNSQSVINNTVIDRLVAQGIGNGDFYTPRPVMIDLKRKGQRRVMEVCGPYAHVLPYLDARSDAMIFDAERRPLTADHISGRWDMLEGITGCILVMPM